MAGPGCTVRCVNDLDYVTDIPMADLPEQLPIAHLSDSHIGYQAYRTLAVSGENQRGVDVARAFAKVCSDIIAWDPPLVIHSGDIAERPVIAIRQMLFIRSWLEKLASLRPDGSRRQVVIIAGNHDIGAHRREACFLELFADLDGVHVITDGVRVVEFTDAGVAGGPAAELANVAVTCVPHDALRDLAIDGGFEEIVPRDGKLNVLVAHGVAGGSGLYKRTLGREYAIPTEVLSRDWAYGALGHWHRRGPISLASTGANKKDPDRQVGRVWYAGSSENMGFGDLLDNGDQRGWLRVIATPGALPTVTPSNVPIRAMHRLAVLDGAGLGPEEIEAALIERLEAAVKANRLAGAVVGQIVRGVPRDVWSLVDQTKAREIAKAALHWEVTVEPVASAAGSQDGEEGPRVVGLAQVGAVLDEVAAAELAAEKPERRDAVMAMAKSLLGAELTAALRTEETDTGGQETTDEEAAA